MSNTSPPPIEKQAPNGSSPKNKSWFLAIICAFVLSSAGLYLCFYLISEVFFATEPFPFPAKRECDPGKHQFTIFLTGRGITRCSGCRKSVYDGKKCSLCGKYASDVFKEEHSCFRNGTGKLLQLPSGLGNKTFPEPKQGFSW